MGGRPQDLHALISPTVRVLQPLSRTASLNSPDLNVSGRLKEAVAVLDIGPVTGTGPLLDVKFQSSSPLERGSLNQIIAGAIDAALRDGAASNLEIAASFAQSGARQAKHIFLMLKRNGTVAAGKVLNVELQADSAGDPSGTALATSLSVAADLIPVTYGWVMFTLATPLDLADGSAYHVVLTGDYDASATDNVSWRANSVASGGNMSFFDAAWAQTATSDLEAYVEQFNFADVPNGAFPQLISTGVWDLQLREYYENLRAVCVIAGTSPDFTFGLNLLPTNRVIG